MHWPLVSQRDWEWGCLFHSWLFPTLNYGPFSHWILMIITTTFFPSPSIEQRQKRERALFLLLRLEYPKQSSMNTAVLVCTWFRCFHHFGHSNRDLHSNIALDLCHLGSVASRLWNCWNHAEYIYQLHKWRASMPINPQKMRTGRIFQQRVQTVSFFFFVSILSGHHLCDFLWWVSCS